MPNLTFELPHWIYWVGLIVFPLIALYLVHRRARPENAPSVTKGVAYLLLVTGGFVGLHRFYLRSALGVVFIPLFLVILLANAQDREARIDVSAARNQIDIAEFMVERYEASAATGDEAAVQLAEQARSELASAQSTLERSTTEYRRWHWIASVCAVIILLLLLVDAVRLPGMVRRRAAREQPLQDPGSDRESYAAGEPRIPGVNTVSPFADRIDRMNSVVGEFVALWSVIAVFAYYYEVIARYVFNSPTNWVHESMFLMFGMQYLLSGAYALREGSHVRVDVLYNYLSLRARAVMDVVTSVFFFIFVGTLLWTGWTFFHDSFGASEVSFTEWGIQYWPVKLAIPIGAALILLQGLADLVRNVLMLKRGEG
ncbi:TRAP-type mannitol/chloroaromatic compound transport system, small permease component [Modicisalibacter muralis]|uniref:TRAP transporter small permease protein n=1 Tax=Modicisalibacter muralis TaxID=119000 RepID=A0A1G9JJ33_9GAMM|nr:TRAP transporter small permease subunit [Halomonas muralis]SDL37620.1 TRAP-type mannitol/chloroaromatic compound transport system, small permease component [Halomonas muralis]